MMCSIIYFIIILLFAITANAEYTHDGENELKDTFFENLRALPILLSKNKLSDSSKNFIKKQIENYKLINSRQKENLSRKKRNLKEALNKYNVEFSPLLNIPAKQPVYLSLVDYKSTNYAFNLENSGQNFVIYSILNKTFTKEASTEVNNAVKLDVYPLKASMLIVVAENRHISSENRDNVKVFEWRFDDKLEEKQNLAIPFASDVKIWNYQHNIYMSITSYKNSKGQYETQTPVFKWLGTYFDVIQYLDTSGAASVTPMWIDDVHYLAVSNAKRNSGNTKTYSEIFRFDVDSETFQPYQRILTRACHDIKHFYFWKSREHFLVTANTHKDVDGKEVYQTNSIVYKLVDDYFIPFQTLPTNGVIQWEFAFDSKNNFLLFSLNKFGEIQLYKYDGWRFVQEDNPFMSNQNDVSSINVDHHNDELVLVVTNQKENSQEIYQIKVHDNNDLEQKYQQMYQWCQNQIQQLSEPKVNKRDTRQQQMELYNQKLDEIQSKLQSINLTATKIEIAGNAMFDNLVTTTINNKNVEKLMENVINIREDIHITKPMHFDTIDITGFLKLREINQHMAKDLVHTYDKIHLKSLNITGVGHFIKNVDIEDTLNGWQITHDDLLLNNVDQKFSTLNRNSMKIENLKTQYLNKLNMEDVQRNVQSRTPEIKSMEDLRVQNLVIGGFINDVDVPTLYKYSLRKEGDQEITKGYLFDNLEVDNMVINGLLSDKNVSDFISISGGEYDIPKNILISNDVHVQDLFVEKFFNNMPVVDGKLKILLKKSEEVQYIEAKKEFENLNILNLIRLQGKIRNKELSEKNILFAVHDKVVLDEDIFIDGDVTIERMLACDDIVDEDLGHNLTNVAKNGLRLADTSIPKRLEFTQPIHVNEIFADEINGVSPDTLVVNGDNQIISGWKTFNGDLRVTGGTNVFSVNDIKVGELESNILMQHGDQTITGKHIVKHLVAEKDINYKTISFGPKNWADVITTNDDQIINGFTVFLEDLKCTTLTTKEIQTAGKFDNHDFNQLVKNVVKIKNLRTIKGRKTFTNLIATDVNLAVQENMFNPASDQNNIRLNQNIHIPRELSVTNIYFSEKINGMSEDNFGGHHLADNKVYKVDGEHEFDTMVVYTKATIDSGNINNISIRHLVEDSVKISEPHEFDNVKFNDPIVINNALLLDGNIENLDLDNIIHANTDEVQVIQGNKNLNMVLATGDVYFNGKLNGKDVKEICSILNHEEPMDLNVKGNVIFAKPTHIRKLNDLLIEDIMNNTWFTDQPTTINQNVTLDYALFKNNINLGGTVNGEDLRDIADNYLSKTKDQTSFAPIVFTNDVVFRDNLTSPQLNVSGDINGIKIEEFLQTVLLNDFSQVFENRVFFEHLITNEIKGEHLVNYLDLESDVIRLDRENIVSGMKTFGQLNIEKANMKEHILVNEIPIIRWLHSLILKNGTFQVLGNYKFYVPPTFERGLGLNGMLNDIDFKKENIMMRDIPQVITGKKTFISDASSPLSFKSIEMEKGKINNVYFSDLIENQANLDKNNVFETPMDFYNNITVDNINIMKHYNNVNMSQFIQNVTSLEVLNNIDENFIELKDMSQKIQQSLEDQAYFIDYYKEILVLENVNNIMGFRGGDGIDRMLTFANASGSLEVGQYVWDFDVDHLVMKGLMHWGTYPNFMEKVLMGNKEYVYLERKIENPINNEYSHEAELVHINNNGSIEILGSHTNGTHFVSYFNLYEHPCLIFIESSKDQITSICSDNGANYYLTGLPHKNADSLSVMNINNDIFLAVLSHGSKHIEPNIEIFKFKSGIFQRQQLIFEGEPTSISSIFYNGEHYLATVFGQKENTMFLGEVTIRRFNYSTEQFDVWQIISLDAPIQIQFSVLPSEELVLYVLTDNPAEPFLVYMYNGVSGFVEHIVGTTLSKSHSMKTFNLENQLFVSTFHNNEISVLQGVFKGNRRIP